MCKDALLQLRHTPAPGPPPEGSQKIQSTNHVFGDLTELVDAQDVRALQMRLACHRSTVDRMIPESSPRRMELIRLESIKFMEYARKITARWQFSRDDKAWCVRHNMEINKTKSGILPLKLDWERNLNSQTLRAAQSLVAINTWLCCPLK